MTEQPKIVFLPHANIQYSQLPPERRAWVMQASYGGLFDLIASDPAYRVGFEASGETIDQMARHAPDVLEKLVALIGAGQIEPVGSPYTHIMLSNVDERIGLATLRHACDVWEHHCGVRPKTGWNPECGWAHYVPDIFKEAGFEQLVADADSFFLSFPDIRAATQLGFDVKGHSNKNQLFRIEKFIADKPDYLRFVTNPSRAPNGIKLIFRSDMMSNLMLWFLMGATEEMRDTPVSLDEIDEMLGRWRPRIAETGSFIMPYAEDAEYIGTSAYFYVKQFGQARFFEPEPDSTQRFRQLLEAARRAGYELATPSEVVATARSLPENPHIANIENGVAWHGGTAKAWSNTVYSRILDPTCRAVFDGILAIASRVGQSLDRLDPELTTALRRVTSAYVSDARWPPAPTSPGRFNVEEALRDLAEANDQLATSMRAHGIEAEKSLYSPGLMRTQIEAVRGELMAMAYFGEK